MPWPSPFGYVIAFVLGSLVGSFGNVCIHRIPRRLSVVFPGSHCPNCQQPIRPWHNIPLLSYAVLGGRCATCHTGIAWRYPFVEGLCGFLYVLLYHQFGASAQSLVLAFITTILLIAACIDLAHTVIPDSLTLPGVVLGLVSSLWVYPIGFGNALLGVGLGGVLFYLIALFSRGGMGGGDIKLIAMIGAFLGWQAVLVTIFLGALCGAVVGITLLLLKRKSRKEPMPFGPFLALGAFLSIVWGERLIAWYTHLTILPSG